MIALLKFQNAEVKLNFLLTHTEQNLRVWITAMPHKQKSE